MSFIDTPNVWYLISGISGESINHSVIKDNQFSSGPHVFDASLAFVSNGNNGNDAAGDTYTDISAADVRLKSAVRNGEGAPFSKGNWAKIDDLDGPLGASVGTWVLTKKKFFEGEYNVLYGFETSAYRVVYGKILEEDETGTNITYDPSSTIVFYDSKNGVTPTKVDGSIIEDVSGNPSCPNPIGFFNRSYLVGNPFPPEGQDDFHDFVTYNLAPGGSKDPFIQQINDLSGGLQSIDFCYGTPEGNYMLVVGSGDSSNSKVIYKLSALDFGPTLLKNKLPDLETIIFSIFNEILDITWIVNPITGNPRWFFCGNTGAGGTSVYFVDDLSGGNCTACNTPDYVSGSMPKYPIGISSTQTLDDTNPRTCPIGLVGQDRADFTRDMSGNTYTFDKGVDGGTGFTGAKKCRMIQVRDNIVLFIIASSESNWSTINLDETGGANNQQFFYDSSGSVVKVYSENLTYLPQANYGNGLIAFGNYEKNLNKVFIYELKNGSVVNNNNPNISTSEYTNKVQAITLIKNRLNII